MKWLVQLLIGKGSKVASVAGHFVAKKVFDTVDADDDTGKRRQSFRPDLNGKLFILRLKVGNFDFDWGRHLANSWPVIQKDNSSKIVC